MKIQVLTGVFIGGLFVLVLSVIGRKFVNKLYSEAEKHAVNNVVGMEYFELLTDYLQLWLKVDVAFAAEVDTGEIPVCLVCASSGSQHKGNFEYPLAGTVCEKAVESGVYACCEESLIHPFADHMGKKFKSYIGMSLVDSKGQAVGILAVMSTKPVRRRAWAQSCLKQFSRRAALEMARLREENETRHQQIHDSLTGVYNYNFFLELKEELAERDNVLPVAAMVCDIDGLKLANDLFGHAYGNKVIQAVAEIFQKSVRQSDYVIRIGGDEFIILLPNCTEDVAAKIVQRIKNNMEQNRVFDLPLSVSLGYTLGEISPPDIFDYVRKADERMYRNKLLSNNNYRDRLGRLMLEIYFKNSFSKEKTEKLRRFISEWGKDLGLSACMLKKLKLFSAFHDLGDTGFLELSSESLISTDIHRQCEIGSYIAHLVPSLTPIADWILKQNEWWDGSGVLGLSARQIPLGCRIFAVADTFVSSVSKGKEAGQVLSEDISGQSGNRFDPELVDRIIAWHYKGKGVAW